MKKRIAGLLIGLMIISGVSHAASVDWSASQIVNNNGSGSPSGYLGAGYTVTLLYSVQSATPTYTVVGTAKTEGSTSFTSVNGTSAVTVTKDTVYQFVFEIDTGIEGDTRYYLSNICTYTGKGSSGIETFAIDFGAQYAGGYVGTWSATSAVPEPTSGLLLLIGMAGLALRRKRA